MFLLQEVELRADVTSYYKFICIKNRSQSTVKPWGAIDTQIGLDPVLGLEISMASETLVSGADHVSSGIRAEGSPVSAITIKQAATHDYNSL
jgi:hypothetical protein